MFRTTITIADNMRAFMFKNQKVQQVLTPGKYTFWDLNNSLSFQQFNIDKLYYSEKSTERMYRKNSVLHEHITHWKLRENEIGLLYKNDKLQGIVSPGEALYLWRDAGELRLERIVLSQDLSVNTALLLQIDRVNANSVDRLICSNRTKSQKPVADFNIPKYFIGLLYIDGALIKKLPAGRFGYWQVFNNVELRTFDTRTTTLEVSGQEILSKDRVSLRVNLTANICITNCELAAKSTDNISEFAYKTLQLALREAVGTKSLDDILMDKLYVNETVKSLVENTLKNVGITLQSVGVKDIILPGEIKVILNQVVEAQKAAEANVIKRREETAATRSLHNTAKVMENNPTLLRLKELEALEKMADKINNLNVYGGLDGLMNSVTKVA